MKGLTIFFTRRPVTVIMILAAVVLAAGFAFTVLPLDRLPHMSVPRVTVETMYPGMTAEDIRSLVTIPIEDAFASIKGLERISSVSRDGSSLVRLEFRWGTDPLAASALVREAVDAVYPALPQGARKPAISPGDPDMEPHAIIAVCAHDESFARRLAGYDLRSMIRRIDGVGSVLLAGGQEDEGHLRLDVPRLAALGLSPPEFAEILYRETADIPAGNAKEGLVELVVVSSGRPQSIEALAELTLPNVRISDAGVISLEAGRKKSVFFFDGKEAAALEIYRRPGSDPIRLSRDIRKVLKEAHERFSHNAEITLVKDSAPSLIQSMIGLAVSAVLGAAAVITVLLIFIRCLRLSLLAALSIPISAAAGVCILAITGRTLNSMSLGGLALGIGLVSDIAVIMLDLLDRHFGDLPQKPSFEETGKRAVSIAGSSMASTLTTAVVFIPVIFLPGPLGSLFGDTAIALVSSVFTGWLYAQLCIPSLYRFTFKLFPHSLHDRTRKNKKNYGTGPLEKKYRKALVPVLRNPRKWIVIAGAASILGAVLLFIRPAVFVNPDAAEEIMVSVNFPPGTMLETIGAYGAALSGRIQELPYITSTYGRAGAEDEDINRRAGMDYRTEELLIRCIPEKGTHIASIQEKIQDIINAIISDAAPSYAGFTVSLPRDRTETLLGLSSALVYAVSGKDREESLERAALAAQSLKETGTVQIHPMFLRPELRLYPHRDVAAYFGISTADIADNLYLLNEGIIASSLEIEGRPLNIRVVGNPDSWNITQGVSLNNIPIQTAQGQHIFLESLGRIERRESDAVLARLDRSDVVTMEIPGGRQTAQAARQLDSSYSWFSKAGESVFSRYRNALLINIFLAIVLIYMTMGAQFESFLLPLVLMLTIPFSIAGSGPALLICNSRLDSGAVLGLCALFGLAVNNALILFEISEERIRDGLTPVKAVVSGAGMRLRPVLVTALTTIFALLPIVLNPLGNAQKSMAAAMLGGLAASTFLSLFILPPVFIRFFTWREKR